MTPADVESRAKELHDQQCGCDRGVTLGWLEYAEITLRRDELLAERDGA